MIDSYTYIDTNNNFQGGLGQMERERVPNCLSVLSVCSLRSVLQANTMK